MPATRPPDYTPRYEESAEEDPPDYAAHSSDVDHRRRARRKHEKRLANGNRKQLHDLFDRHLVIAPPGDRAVLSEWTTELSRQIEASHAPGWNFLYRANFEEILCHIETVLSGKVTVREGRKEILETLLDGIISWSRAGGERAGRTEEDKNVHETVLEQWKGDVLHELETTFGMRFQDHNYVDYENWLGAFAVLDKIREDHSPASPFSLLLCPLVR
ncbi:hypothetical protein JCM11491_002068 [Sporobolomyces phaffii]